MSDEADRTIGTEATACSVIAAGQPWWNQTFTEQRAMFHAEFDATPSATTIDAVIGLSDGAASGFTKLAAIVRFNQAGYVDARAGGTYRADQQYPYFAGATYHVRLDVDVRTHLYTVWIAVGAGSTSYTRIASGYGFRTEQIGVQRLTNAGARVDSASGSIQLCGLTVVADVTTGDGCANVTASDGFVSLPITDATRVQVLDFSASASAAGMDAVIGTSAAPAHAFNDLATAVRFNTSGALDARDGDAYRADLAQPYGATTWQFHTIADLTSHTYSAILVHSFESQELARQYHFRTQQQAVGHLAYLDLIVDGTPGTLKVCGIRAKSADVAYTREGDPWVLPLAGGAALISDAGATTRVDANGKVLASYGHGGALATDVLGNVFLGSAAGNTVTVEKTDPNFVSRWTAHQTVLAGAQVVAMATDPAGTVSVGLITPQEKTVQVFRFNAGGTYTSGLSASGDWIALDGDGSAVVAWNDNNTTLSITRFATNGATIWQRSFAGAADVGAMAIGPDHSVVFGGRLFGTADFGGGPIHGTSNDNAGSLDAFWVKLAAGGSHVASRATGDDIVNGLTANGSGFAASSTYKTQFFYPVYTVYDAGGNVVTGGGSPLDDEGFGEHGFGKRIAIGDTGRVWWNFDMQVAPVDRRFPYSAAIDP